MAGEFKPGAVLEWDGFKFDREGAAPKDKLLIVLGSKPNRDLLMVLTTSQRHMRSFKSGCHAEYGYFFISGGKQDFFIKETWVILGEPKIAARAEVIKGGLSNTIRVAGNLRQEMVSALVNCLKRTKDTSDLHLSLL